MDFFFKIKGSILVHLKHISDILELSEDKEPVWLHQTAYKSFISGVSAVVLTVCRVAPSKN